MSTFAAKIAAFLRNEDGSPAIEYPLIAAAIAMLVLSAVSALGGGVQDVFAAVSNSTGASLTNAGAALN